MDRNSIIGLVLIIGILAIYSIFTMPSEKDKLTAKRRYDSMVKVRELEDIQAKQQKAIEDSTQKVLSAQDDSVKVKHLQDQYGAFSDAAKDSNEFFEIGNNLLNLKICTKGGRPYSVELKNYKRYNSKPLVLFDGDTTVFGLNFFSKNKTIFTNDLFFKPANNRKTVVVTNKPDSISMRLYAGENAYIEYTYTVKPDNYLVHFTINFINMDKIIDANQRTPDLVWKMLVPRQEKGATNEDSYTHLQYKYLNDDEESFSASKDEENKSITTKLKWIAFKQQFFSSVLIAGESFSNADLKSNKIADTSRYLKQYAANISVNYENVPKYSLPMSFYFGPNHYPTLKKYNLNLEELVFVGKNIIRGINKFVIIPIFNWLNNFISNFGIIILLLTLIIKIGLFPLTYKSYLSQAKMRVLKPQVDEINKKIPKEKAMERQQAVMALYKKAGVNPLGGCLPMLLQFPILIAMYRFFPTSIELRQEGFLWAKDLSTYDSILNLPFHIPFYGSHISLFTILMTVTTIISMKMSQTQVTDNQIPGMKTMMYIMPVMFMFILNNFSAGLTYYYFLANMITIGQNELFKRMINEQKLLKKIQANKAKVVKKSKFQESLEKMARERGYKTPKK
jgi:YidC/Oxa1 family membrane protein insertase